jgi:hypothetical protein
MSVRVGVETAGHLHRQQAAAKRLEIPPPWWRLDYLVSQSGLGAGRA